MGAVNQFTFKNHKAARAGYRLAQFIGQMNTFKGLAKDDKLLSGTTQSELAKIKNKHGISFSNLEDLRARLENVDCDRDLNILVEQINDLEKSGVIQELNKCIIENEPSMALKFKKLGFIYNLDLMNSVLQDKNNCQVPTNFDMTQTDFMRENKEYVNSILEKDEIKPHHLGASPQTIICKNAKDESVQRSSFSKADINAICQVIRKIRLGDDGFSNAFFYNNKGMMEKGFSKILADLKADCSGELAKLQTKAGLSHLDLSASTQQSKPDSTSSS
jgi:hypothetical protein